MTSIAIAANTATENFTLESVQQVFDRWHSIRSHMRN